MELEEAIKRLKEKIQPTRFGGFCALSYSEKYCFGKPDLEAIDTVLKELDIYKGVINKQSVDISKYLQELDKKDKENKQLKNDNQVLEETLYGGNTSEEV